MRPLADAACELPWLAPCADSLVALTREPSSSLWSSLRGDPGLVLLLLRQQSHGGAPSSLSFYTSLVHDPGVLEMALHLLDQDQGSFVDWHEPRMLPTYRTALACALAAEALARRTDRCDVENAWVGGLLAPLGSMAAASVDRERWTVDTKGGGFSASLFAFHRSPSATAAIARRLAAAWKLPPWLSAVIGHLGLPLDAARALGADPDHFLVVQLAAALAEQAGFRSILALATPLDELVQALDLTAAEVQEIVASLKQSVNELALPRKWTSPASLPLLPDLLRLAVKNRHVAQFAERSRLHVEVDALHTAIQQQRAGEAQRLKELKLRALAELAAGAGHEINNPLAVISGQAQYLMVSEQETSRRKSLQTIIGQAQRIHQTLTQLMQFARPPMPRKERIDLGGLISEIVGSLRGLADDRQVQLRCEESPSALTLFIDPGQIRAAIFGLLRNAIEAAPANGWASLRLAQSATEGLTIAVEDSGPGPSPADREHLFDPFYSGRKAGRGPGLGLPAAWQLVRQHGGDVRFDSDGKGPTRFLLSLPADAIVESLPLLPERNGTSGVYPVAQSA